ncbi:hypothetical protein B0H11DRAFT_2418089 [Mycena galericulata]|nr:hypothetical protein B0H11DRAFT_2418089 [Mycena galericulata]
MAELLGLDSPFNRMLHTNVIPTDLESKQIHDLLTGFFESLENLDEDSSHIHASLHALDLKRTRLRANIQAHRALVSPARRLHEDVLREIFLSCLPTSHNGIMHPSHSPLLLGQVCSGWRQITVTTPQLWASLHIVIPPASRVEGISNLILTWLGRSGVLPLEISITVSHAFTTDPAGYSESVSNLLDVIASFSRRWRSIEFISPPASAVHRSESFLVPLAKLLPESVPMLEQATFNFTSYPMFDMGSLPFLHASGMQSVSFSSTKGDFQSLSLPWRVITKLQLGGFESLSSLSVTSSLQMLQQCPNIQTCVMSIGLSDNGDFTETLLLLHLVFLSVTFRGHTSPEEFFARLTVPGLKSLTYASADHQLNLPFMTLLADGVQLESMDLEVKGLSRTAFLDCCQHIHPTITSMRLHFITEDLSGWPGYTPPIPPLNDDTIHILISEPGSKAPCLFPCLKSIELVDCNEISDEVLIEFIQSREHSSWHGSRLRRVHVAFTREMQKDILACLFESTKRGLDMSFLYADRTGKRSNVHYFPWEGVVDA